MSQRLPSRLYQAYEARGAATLKAAADVARGVHGAGAALTARQSPQAVRGLKQREAQALRLWARRERHILDAAAFERKWRKQGRIGGQENDVYLSANRVFKRNNLSFHLSYADFFDRLALHNLIFPGAPLSFEGFVERQNGLWPIMSQPAVRARQGASRAEVEVFMHRLGFKRIKYDDYRHPEGILVEDLHDENVFIDEEGEVVVIDPVIYLIGARPAGRSVRLQQVHGILRGVRCCRVYNFRRREGNRRRPRERQRRVEGVYEKAGRDRELFRRAAARAGHQVRGLIQVTSGTRTVGADLVSARAGVDQPRPLLLPKRRIEVHWHEPADQTRRTRRTRRRKDAQ